MDEDVVGAGDSTRSGGSGGLDVALGSAGSGLDELVGVGRLGSGRGCGLGLGSGVGVGLGFEVGWAG